MQDGSVTNISGITGGAAYLKGIKLSLTKFSHSKSGNAIDFYAKAPFMPGLTITLPTSHFDNPSVWGDVSLSYDEMRPASLLAALQEKITSYGFPKYLLPPDEGVSWKESTNGDGSTTVEVNLSGGSRA